MPIFSEEEREQIRTDMLEAGFPLLKQYGMTHTSISKITGAAGIAVGTFYHFWKSKEEYMAELIEYHRRKISTPALKPEPIGARAWHEADDREP